MDFDPAGCLLDRLPVVVGTPTLHERQPGQNLLEALYSIHKASRLRAQVRKAYFHENDEKVSHNDLSMQSLLRSSTPIPAAELRVMAGVSPPPPSPPPATRLGQNGEIIVKPRPGIFVTCQQRLLLEPLQPPELLQLAVAFDDNTGAGQKPDQVNPQW